MPASANRPARPKTPKQLAVIDPDNCTGCEACIEVCPVDCIALHTRGLGVKGTQTWCEIDWDRCIGCELCVRIPRRNSEPYELLVCPWEAITMVPPASLPEVAAELGGPSDDLSERRDRLLDVACRLAEAATAS